MAQFTHFKPFKPNYFSPMVGSWSSHYENYWRTASARSNSSTYSTTISITEIAVTIISCWSQNSSQRTDSISISQSKLKKLLIHFNFYSKIFSSLYVIPPPHTLHFYVIRQRNSLNKAMFLHLLQKVCLPCTVCKHRFPLTFVISPPLHKALHISITRESNHLIFI